MNDWSQTRMQKLSGSNSEELKRLRKLSPEKFEAEKKLFLERTRVLRDSDRAEMAKDLKPAARLEELSANDYEREKKSLLSSVRFLGAKQRKETEELEEAKKEIRALRAEILELDKINRGNT